MLTQLAKTKLDALISEACDAQYKLEFTPSTTDELANSLTFLDEIQERVRKTFHVSLAIVRIPTMQCFTVRRHQPSLLSSVPSSAI